MKSSNKKDQKKPAKKVQVKSTSVATTGKPAEYSPDLPSKIQIMAWIKGRGPTHKEMAIEFGCSQATIVKWIRERPEFAAAYRNPLEQLQSKLGYQAIKAATEGRTEIEEGPQGVRIKKAEPTPRDLMEARSFGMLNPQKIEARADSETMKPHLARYRKKEISINELLDAYSVEGCRVPAHLQEEHKIILKQEAAQEVVESLSDKDQEIVNAALARLGLL